MLSQMMDAIHYNSMCEEYITKLTTLTGRSRDEVKNLAFEHAKRSPLSLMNVLRRMIEHESEMKQ